MQTGSAHLHVNVILNESRLSDLARHTGVAKPLLYAVFEDYLSQSFTFLQGAGGQDPEIVLSRDYWSGPDDGLAIVSAYFLTAPDGRRILGMIATQAQHLQQRLIEIVQSDWQRLARTYAIAP